MQITFNPPTNQAEVDLALTITAQALILSEASNERAQETNTPLVPTAQDSTSQSTPTPNSAPAAQQSPTPSFTPTSSTTMVSVSVATNCRTGPGQTYDIVGSLLVGEIAEVVGKNSGSNYWIITNPDQPTSTCWLWGKYAIVSGNQNSLAEVSIPPSPTPTRLSAPNTVSNLQGSGSCDDLGGGPGYHLHTVSGTINWKDNANNEQGFNIYADYLHGDPPKLLGSVSANTTSYGFSVITIDDAFAILVTSYNAAGSSKNASVNIPYNCHP
jgi:hypothetical protein